MRATPPDIPRTSEIPFFSTVHGRARRSLRGIERRDLQAAIRHGDKEPARPDPRTGAKRWKYTYANITFITDETSTREITSYIQPVDIPEATLSLEQIKEHCDAEERLRRQPSLCTSHTVIVVDHSASMKTSDVTDFENRAKAVFGMLAVDFVAKQRLSGVAADTDVVSLVLMDDWVTVVFEREPMGLVLYNKLVGLHHKVKPRSHGNFLPSLDQAQQLFSEDHDGSALCLLFLSDGRPSDNCTGVVEGSFQMAAEAITERMSELATTFRDRLAVATLGFGRPGQDFAVLEAMAKSAREAGAKAEFHRPELSSIGLGSAIAASVSSLTATKSRLFTSLAPLSGGNHRPIPTPKKVEKEYACCGDSWRHAPTTSETGDGWVIYTDSVQRYEYRPLSVRGLEAHPWVMQDFFSSRADGIVIRRKAFGEGAERLVFGMQEYDSRSGKMVGPELVAKESKQEGLDGQKSSFHDIFASTQATASKIARRFNMLVRERLALYNGSNELVDHRVWDITFLSCSVYSFMEAGVERFVLAEKRLEPASAYRKWNGNNGYVFNGQGKISANPTLGLYSGESDMPEIMKTAFATDDNSSFCDSEDGAGSTFSQESCLGFGIGRSSGSSLCPWVATSRGCKRARDEMPLIFRPQPDDYLQAFSHFSYWKSGRRMLVCDLQGVMTRNASSDDGPAGVFELTDPVIHYCSKTGRKQVYGRTDLGKKGMHKFFRTHECNDVCRLLGLPGCWSPGGLGTVEAEKRADAGVEMPPPPLPRASLAKPSYKRRKFI